MPQHNYTTPKRPMAAPTSSISQGGEAVVVVTGPIRGGYLQNPFNGGQGVVPESLFVDFVNTPAACGEKAHKTTIELPPGERLALPPLQPGVQLKANAETAGHQFTAVVW